MAMWACRAVESALRSSPSTRPYRTKYHPRNGRFVRRDTGVVWRNQSLRSGAVRNLQLRQLRIVNVVVDVTERLTQIPECVKHLISLLSLEGFQ